MTDVGGPRSLWVVHLWAGGPELYKKANWRSWAQASKQPVSVASTLVSASKVLSEFPMQGSFVYLNKEKWAKQEKANRLEVLCEGPWCVSPSCKISCFKIHLLFPQLH